MVYAGTAPTLASGANIGAFNVGNALGAWAGGLGIAAGFGYTSPLWIGAGITAAAVVVLAATVARGRRSGAASSGGERDAALESAHR
jgi:DHA1 family inner membrane transport protein